ncbi:peptidoglycan DD-metalloendopeptidase family protein [Sinomonas soli]
MAQEIATAYISLVPSMRGFNTTVSRELQGLDKPAAAAGESTGSKFLSGLGKTAKIGAVAIGGVLSTSLVKGFQRLSAIENAEGKLRGLGNSAQDVSAIMKNALAAVKGTAFGMDEAATVAASATAAGIKPGKELEGVLRLVGDAATIGGSSLGEMGAIFNKVAASNKIQGDSIAQLQDRGIPILQFLGKQLGVTAEEAAKMASKGKIDFATFRKAMEEGLGGAALQSGNTTTGAFKNMNAALSRFGAALLKEVFPIIGPVFNKITDGLDKATAKVGPFISGLMLIGKTDVLTPDVVAKMGLDPNGPFGKAMTELVGGIRAFGAAWTANDGDITSSGFPGFMERAAFWLREVTGGFQAFKAAWDANDGDVTSSGFPGFMEELANKFRAVQASLAKLDFSSFQGFTQSLIAEGGPATTLIGGLGDALPKLGGSVATIIGAGLDALAGILGFMADHMDVILPMIPVVVAGFLAWHAATSALAWQTHALQAAQLAMTPVLVTNNALRVTAALLEGRNARETARAAAATAAQTAATAGNTAATVGNTIATNGMSIAQRAAAAAQRLLNGAMRANPIGLIITAIMALVAGLVWFFTQTEFGKQIIANVWGFIQSVIGAVGAWFTGTLVPAFQAGAAWVGSAFTWLNDTIVQPVFAAIGAAIQSVGDFFNWLYVTVVQPVFNAIAAVIGWWWTTIVMPYFGFVSAAVQAVGGFFSWLYNDILDPIFQLAGAIIAFWWNTMVMPVFNAVISFVRDSLAAVFNWFRDAIITPVFNAVGATINWIGSVFQWLYDFVVKPVFDAVGAAIKWVSDNVINPVVAAWNDWFGVKLPAVFQWLYTYVIKPQFDAIGAVINWVWLNVIKPVVDAWNDWFGVKLPAVFNWLHDNVIKPVMDGIGSAIKWVWDNTIKPVFDFIRNAVEVEVPKAFEAGKAAIDTIWKGIQDVVKAPVRFVVETVINGGIVDTFNKVADVFGTKHLGHIELPPGFSEGGYTGPGAKKKPAGIVHAGEVVWSQDDIARWGGVGVVEALRRARGYLGGGLVDPLRGGLSVTQGYNHVHKGIDFAAAIGTPVFAANDGAVTWAGPGVQAPGVWGGNEVHILGNGIETWYAHLSSIGVQLGELVRAGQQIALSGNTGISSGPHLHFGVFQGGWPNDLDPNGFLSGTQADGKPFNPIAGIIDGLMDQFKKAFPGSEFVVDMVGGFAKNLLNMAADGVMALLTGNRDGKGSAASTLFDGGGWLERTAGPMLVEHNRAKPDAVLSNEQWTSVHSLAQSVAAGGAGLTIQGDVYGANAEEIMDEIEKRGRRSATVNGLARIAAGVG